MMTKTDEKKNLVPYSNEWEKIANGLARDWVYGIYPCKKCNYPVIPRYVCQFCGDSSPSQPADENTETGTG